MTELKKFVHQNPLSICTNNDDIDEDQNVNQTKNEMEKFSLSDHFDGVLKKSVPYLNITSNLYDSRKYNSLTNLNDIVNSIRRSSILVLRVTVFRQDGTIVSHPYYDDFLRLNMEMVQSDVKKETNNYIKNSLKLETDTQKPNFHDVSKTTEADTNRKLPMVPSNSKEHRKSLMLPLKSLSIESAETPTESLVNRRYSSGVQLTPLISKLSMLAFEERSSGFCSRETTPCDYRGFTPVQTNYSFPYSKFKNKEIRNAKNEDDKSLRRCVLFVCGQQDVVLAMLLRDECGEDPSTVKKLWEICTEHLGKLEKQLNRCMESQSGANSNESEPYSYLCVDSDWDTIKKGWSLGYRRLGNPELSAPRF
ncbi:hypothetical protein NQ317_012823 [Molorchus minor]|uniref:Uncharacterized protein n=1 Tax=Molorchus minor TaxID=1323400 RepID=A0ABQ9K3I5_9CUCU|nr:hypothetical protein NQ317_012823 [Molorchus minor]